MKKNYIIAIGLIFFILLTRFLPHPPNFTPILAIALFGGALFKNKQLAYLFPLIAMFITDLVLGLHESLFAVYLSLVAIIFIGSRIDSGKVSNVAFAALASSIIFFLVTNFSVWLLTDLYTSDFSGLLMSYSLAIPFFKWNLLSNILYSGVLFISYNLLTYKTLKLQKIEIE